MSTSSSNPPTTEVIALAVVAPKPGASAADLEPLFLQMVEGAAAADAGTLHYAFYRSPNGTYRVIERYTGPAAYLDHTHNIDPVLLHRLLEIAEFREVEILGDPGDAIRERIAPMRPRYLLAISLPPDPPPIPPNSKLDFPLVPPAP